MLNSWEFRLGVVAAVWCAGLATIGVLQYEVATAPPIVTKVTPKIEWTTAASTHPLRSKADLVGRIRVSVSPPIYRPQPVIIAVSSKLNPANKMTINHLIPPGVAEFPLGFNLGSRQHSYTVEQVELEIHPVADLELGNSKHVATFEAKAYRARLVASAAYLQAGDIDEVSVQVELIDARAREQMEFGYNVQGSAIDAQEIKVSRPEKLSVGPLNSVPSAIVFRVVQSVSVESEIVVRATPPLSEKQSVKLEVDEVRIQVRKPKKPVIRIAISEPSISEGESTRITADVVGGTIFGPVDVQVKIAGGDVTSGDLQLEGDAVSVANLKLSPTETSTSLAVAATDDFVVLENSENAVFEFTTSADVELSVEGKELVITDNDKIADVTMIRSSTSKLTEGPENRTARISATLKEGQTAGRSIAIPFRTTDPTSATVSGVPTAVTTASDADLTIENYDATKQLGSVLIPAGKQSGEIQLSIIDDKVVREKEELVSLVFAPPPNIRLQGPEGPANPHVQMEFTIIDNDLRLFEPLKSVAIREGESLPGGVLKLANIVGEFPQEQRLAFSIEPSSTATVNVDYNIPGVQENKGELVIPAGSTSISLPISIVDDALSEPAETIDLNFSTERDLGKIRILIHDNDNPNRLENRGDLLVLVLVSADFVDKWNAFGPMLKSTLDDSKRLGLVSDSLIFVHPEMGASKWTKVSRLDPAKIPVWKFSDEVVLNDQLKHAVDVWNDIRKELAGRVPKRTVVVISTSSPRLGTIEELTIPDFDRDQASIRCFWYGGADSQNIFFQEGQQLSTAFAGIAGNQSPLLYLRKETPLAEKLAPR